MGSPEKFSLSAPAPEFVEPHLEALEPKKDEAILATYSEVQRADIEHKLNVLSSLAYFIGKDFKIPVELNEPGQGWHWDFQENKIRVDPQDLLDKPMDYLRFVISHEGGHRRISRTEFISTEEWQQPGFSFMMNAIEDPRMNNFVSEAYPKFREQMVVAYQQQLDIEVRAKEQAAEKLGRQPRFMQAGFEYIQQWFREVEGKDLAIAEELPDDVKDVVRATLPAAQDSWWRYPSRQEADTSEDLITEYARVSYKINRDKIWPEFQKLVEQDLVDQTTQEALKDMQQSEGTPQVPSELQDTLAPDEQATLREALKEPAGAAIPLDALSEGVQQKIKDYLDSLPEEQRQELTDKARAALGEFSEAISQEFQGKLSDNPTQWSERATASPQPAEPVPEQTPVRSETDPAELKKYRERLDRELHRDANIYETTRREVLPLIDTLENDLREIFVARRAAGWHSGFKTGKRINIKHRIQEKAKDIPAVESKAWQKRELPQEKDYAITLLVDLSGSMSRQQKIEETFKGVVALTEALNRLSINMEVLGFNDQIYDYQSFGQPMSEEVREHMGGMFAEVEDTSGGGKAHYNDDGWALTQASERLARQRADQKFLIVLSDGTPEESPEHPREQFELSSMIQQIRENTDQHLIGLGIGRGTEHVGSYYPNSIANVRVNEMAAQMAALIKEAIAHYEEF